MRLTDIWSTRKRPTVSFELFPARSAAAEGKLERVIDKLAALDPDFVSVTFGAGGATREGSAGLVRKLKHEKGLEVLAYFAGYGLGPGTITEILDGYRETGVENVLVVRGDLPREEAEFRPHPESLPHASDLLTLIRGRYDFCLGAAGYPEGHVEAESLEQDLRYVKLKVDCGAEFVIANYFYDNRFFLHFRERCRELGISVPIIAGVMPIFSVKMMESLAQLCGATITDAVRRGLAELPDGDKEALSDFGIALATEQCRGLIEAGVDGLHIYTMDRSKSAVGIVRQLRAEGLL